ncbi:MAG: flagellar type III secretion system protein FlhB [Hyphomicrobiaceae bacterium]|nr:flagellar type III secretion system protein FlhB [Hyphomicrobiaceae bacterium]
MAASDDREGKVEEPSERKIRDAVERGNIPFSREAATFGSVLGILLVAGLFSSGIGRLRDALRRFIDDPARWPLENGGDAVRLLDHVGAEAAGVLVPAILVLGLMGIAASLLQNPPRLVLDRILPKPSRLSLGHGWTRVFGARGRVEFLKATFKLAAVGGAGFILLRATQSSVLNAMFMEPGVLPELILELAVRLVGGIALATLGLAALDLVWARVFWRRELRMTRQELKDETKQMDGDPALKARMRSLARDRSRRRMMAAVPRATLVIANPTHYAVALRYLREEGGAPRVLAKGRDLIALRIRELAEQHGIPVIEDRLLARSLHDKVEVDRMIPPEFYRAVAQIVYFVTSRKGGRIERLRS